MSRKTRSKSVRKGVNEIQYTKTQQIVWDAVDQMISNINNKPRLWIKKLTQDLLKKDRKKKQSNCSINSAYYKMLESKTKKLPSEKTLFLIRILEKYQKQLQKLMNQLSKVPKEQALQIQQTLHINLGMILENIQQLSSQPIQGDQKYVQNFMNDALHEAWKIVKDVEKNQNQDQVYNDYEIEIIKNVIPKKRVRRNKETKIAKEQYITEQKNNIQTKQQYKKMKPSSVQEQEEQELNNQINVQKQYKNSNKPQYIRQHNSSAWIKQQIMDENQNIILEQPSQENPITPFKYKRTYDSKFIQTTAKNMVEEVNNILDFNKNDVQPIFVQSINIKVRLSEYYAEIQAICKENPPEWEIKVQNNSIEFCICKPTQKQDIVYYLQPAFRKIMTPLSSLVEKKHNQFFNTLIWVLKLLSFESDNHNVNYFQKGIKKKLSLEQIIFLLQPLMTEISQNSKIGQICFEVIKSTAQILQLLSPNIVEDTKQLHQVGQFLLSSIADFRKFFELGRISAILKNQEKLETFHNIFFGSQNEYAKWTVEEQFGIEKTIYVLITAMRQDLKKVDNIVQDVIDKAFKGSQVYPSKQEQINSKLSHIFESYNGNIFKKMLNWIISRFSDTYI